MNRQLLDLSEARAAIGRDPGPVLQVRFARTITPAPIGKGVAARRPFTFATHYNPPCLVRLVRQVLAHLETPWRRIEAVAGENEREILLRSRGEEPQLLATLALVSDHDPQVAFKSDPFTTEGVQDAINATRFGGENGWRANPNHMNSKKGEQS